MTFQTLSGEEWDLILRCLKAATEGPFFPEWEFPILFGLTREEVRSVWASSTGLDTQDATVRLAINNSFANLLGYPHGEREAWDRLISAPRGEVVRIFGKWREHDGRT